MTPTCQSCSLPLAFPPEADCPTPEVHTFPQPAHRPETEAEVAQVRSDLAAAKAQVAQETPDFIVTNHLTLYLLTPVTEAAKDWCEECLPGDAPMFGFSYGIDPRCIEAIVAGIQEDGLDIE